MSGFLNPFRALLAAAGIAAFGARPVAQSVAADNAVDVELVLAVDVSLSMSPAELAIQRDGYAAALTDQRVLDAIRDGAHGRVAVTYVEWAGDTMQHVVVPWTVIAGRTDAAAFVARMTATPPRSARRTSISGVLAFAADLLAESGFRGSKRVIDVSGDGPNNQGRAVTDARDAVVAQGITINGLPLLTSGGGIGFDYPHLDAYYADCVIGGPGAFTVPVTEWRQFPEAIRRKLVMELAGIGQVRATFIKTAAHAAPADCMAGEKMWQNRSWMWDSR